MSDTRQVARRDFDAWTSGDTDTVAGLLAPDFSFAGGDLRIDGREAFLAAGAFPRDATTSIRDGQIAGSVFVTAMAAFMAFAGTGAGARGGDRP